MCRCSRRRLGCQLSTLNSVAEVCLKHLLCSRRGHPGGLAEVKRREAHPTTPLMLGKRCQQRDWVLLMGAVEQQRVRPCLPGLVVEPLESLLHRSGGMGAIQTQCQDTVWAACRSQGVSAAWPPCSPQPCGTSRGHRSSGRRQVSPGCRADSRGCWGDARLLAPARRGSALQIALHQSQCQRRIQALVRGTPCDGLRDIHARCPLRGCQARLQP